MDWSRLVKDIELLARAGCYEKVNNFLGLGSVNELRRNAARLVVSGKGAYGDLGGGPGTSTKVLLGEAEDSTILLLDPSLEMLALSVNSIRDSRVIRLAGRFEKLPFNDNSITGITAMFSFRDAIDYYQALDEMARVLAPNGRLVILDIYHHDNPLIHMVVKTYIAIMVPLAILFNRCSLKYLSTYKSFLKSIDRMLTSKELLKELHKRFTRAMLIPFLPGAGIFYAEGPRV